MMYIIKFIFFFLYTVRGTGIKIIPVGIDDVKLWWNNLDFKPGAGAFAYTPTKNRFNTNLA